MADKYVFLMWLIVPSHVFSFLQIFPPSEKIENINDQYWTLRAEEASFPFFHPVEVNRWELFFIKNYGGIAFLVVHWKY